MDKDTLKVFKVFGFIVTASITLYSVVKIMAETANRVDAVRTKLTVKQAKDVLAKALTVELGRNPTTNELAMLVAQSAFETANWQSMFHWNFGNSVVGASNGKWYTLKNDANLPLESRHKYKVFSNANEGALYYVKLLHKQFPKAFALLGSNDTKAFAQALKDSHYYETTVDKYAAGLNSRLTLVG